MNSDDKKAWEDAYREAQKPRQVDDSGRSSLIVTVIFVLLGLLALWLLFDMAG